MSDRILATVELSPKATPLTGRGTLRQLHTYLPAASVATLRLTNKNGGFTLFQLEDRFFAVWRVQAASNGSR